MVRSEQRRSEMVELYQNGFNCPDIGKKYGISKQRVYQLIGKLINVNRLVERTCRNCPAIISSKMRYSKSQSQSLCPKCYQRRGSRYNSCECGKNKRKNSKWCQECRKEINLNEALSDKLANLYKQGLNCKKISNETGVKLSTVYLRLRKHFNGERLRNIRKTECLGN